MPGIVRFRSSDPRHLGSNDHRAGCLRRARRCDSKITRRRFRRGPWKAVRYGMEASVELYNLDVDPGETENQEKEEPGIHREFFELFEQHKG